MRIGLIAPEFPPDIGGVETYGYQFATELVRRGHRVFVFTCPHREGEVSKAGFEILPLLKVDYASDRRILREHPMDVWHVMNAGYAWMALETRPVIISAHGNDFIQPYFLPRQPNLRHIPGLWRFSLPFERLWSRLWRKFALRMMRRGLSQATQVIANSQYTRNLLTLRYPGCSDKISVGYVGVDPEFFREPRARGNVDQPKQLVTVCRLSDARKNVDKVLRALAQLKRFPFQYTLIGDGKMRPNIEALCRELDLGDRVICTGFVPKPEMRRILSKSDLFILTAGVLPDSIEGFGIAYLEANACGTPVLAARTGGAVEAVNEGKSGYFVDEPTIPEIATALERYLSGNIRFKGVDCQAFAKKCAWASVVDNAMAFYPD